MFSNYVKTPTFSRQTASLHLKFKNKNNVNVAFSRRYVGQTPQTSDTIKRRTNVLPGDTTVKCMYELPLYQEIMNLQCFLYILRRYRLKQNECRGNIRGV